MAKQHAPATLRNRDAIAQVLARELPAQGRVLEIASGTGEHAAFFAERFPALEWQPSDPSGEALASIAAYRVDYPGGNLAGPVLLDAAAPEGWPVAAAEAIVCINMVHISPWEATLGLFAGAARLLDRHGGPLILYGPYLEQGVDTAPSNLEFDASLKARDGRWGLREAEALDRLAATSGMARSARYGLPTNNIMLVYRPGAKAA
jgi:SAM-dependent methyltransferase